MSLPMLLLSGRVDHVYLSDDSVNKETGESIGGSYKLQLVCDVPQKNGETRREMQTVKTIYSDYFKQVVGTFISIPVGVFIMFKDGKPVAGYFILKSWKPPVAAAVAALSEVA